MRSALARGGRSAGRVGRRVAGRCSRRRLSALGLKCPHAAADKPAMDMSGWLVGAGIGAVAAAAAAWAWHRQRQQLAELAQRLEASEHSRLDLEAHAQQVDGQLASMAQALAHQQAAWNSARALPAEAVAAVPNTAVQALLQHLGDNGPVVIDPQAEWIDTEPSSDADETSPYPAFAETLPAEFVDPTGA